VFSWATGAPATGAGVGAEATGASAEAVGSAVGSSTVDATGAGVDATGTSTAAVGSDVGSCVVAVGVFTAVGCGAVGAIPVGAVALGVIPVGAGRVGVLVGTAAGLVGLAGAVGVGLDGDMVADGFCMFISISMPESILSVLICVPLGLQDLLPLLLLLSDDLLLP